MSSIIVEKYIDKGEKSTFHIIDIENQEDIQVFSLVFEDMTIHIDYEQLEILMRRLPKLDKGYYLAKM